MGHPLLFQILQARALQLLDGGRTALALPLLEEALAFEQLDHQPPAEELDLVREALQEARRRFPMQGEPSGEN